MICFVKAIIYKYFMNSQLIHEIYKYSGTIHNTTVLLTYSGKY